MPDVIDVRLLQSACPRDEGAEKVRAISSRLIAQPHPRRPPGHTERPSVSWLGVLTEGPEPERHKRLPFGMRAIAPFNEVDAMRKVVVVHVSVQELVRPCTRVAP
jgi:hypothetical protein